MKYMKYIYLSHDKAINPLSVTTVDFKTKSQDLPLQATPETSFYPTITPSTHIYR